MFIRRPSFPESDGESLFLWGARQTGKSTLLKTLYPDALWYDLLLADVYERLFRNPTQLRENILTLFEKHIVVIDEIQN